MKPVIKGMAGVWMKFRPYTKPARSDQYYVPICIKVRDTMNNPKYREIFAIFKHIEVSELAAYIVCYFEESESKRTGHCLFVNLMLVI